MKRIAVLVTLLALFALLIAELMKALPWQWQGLSPDVFLTKVVTAGLLGLGLLVATWYFLSTAALLLAQVLTFLGTHPRRLLHATSRLGAPLLRQLAVAGTLVAVATPSWAAPPADVPETNEPAVFSLTANQPRSSGPLVDLGWAPATTEDRGISPAPLAASTPADTPAPTASPAPPHKPTQTEIPDPTVHVVQPGETLWSIASAHLRAHNASATTAEIAREWPRWHAHNASVIGANPHIIHPGMHLSTPPKEES